MTAAEQVADRKQLDRERVNLARDHRRPPLPAVAVAHLQRPFAQVHRKPFQVILVRRMHIDLLGGKIRVEAIRGDPQLGP